MDCWIAAKKFCPNLEMHDGRSGIPMMKYYIYQMEFKQGVHFGSGHLDRSCSAFHADTLFSALCQEALKGSGDELDHLVALVKESSICFSDGLPYANICGRKEIFLPKPLMLCDAIYQKQDEARGGKNKKAYKKLSFLPFGLFDAFLSGEYPVERLHDLEDFGHTETRTGAFVRNDDETLPYRIGTFHYHDGNGLYVIAGFVEESHRVFFETLLQRLSYSGLGGKRSAGLGRFTYAAEQLPDGIEEFFEGNFPYYMTLSVSMPGDSELESSLSGAFYALEKRSGFVASKTYAPEYRKKQDFYVFAHGSVFKKRFAGGVYDVSGDGSHPVYRYAKPLFWGIDWEG